MKRSSYFYYSFFVVSLVLLASCGKDNLASKSGSSSQSLIGVECSANSEFFPVCDTDKMVRYDNSSVAACYKAVNLVKGSCIPDYGLTVCAKDKYTGAVKLVNEPDAINLTEYGRNSIQKYAKSCN